MKLILSVFSLFFFLLSQPAFSSVTIVPLKANDKAIDNFGFVGMMLNVNNGSCGSGTVIGDGSFVLTARHVVSHNGSDIGMLLDGSNFVFVIGNKKYKILNVYGHPSADIAIVKIDGSHQQAAKLSFSTNFIDKEFYGTGYGKGSSSATSKCIDWDLEYGNMRVYKNKIDTEFINLKVAGSSIITTKVFIFDLSDPDTLGKCNGAIEGEGIHGPGDSGGGVFVIEDGELHIFGVISALTQESPYTGFVHDVSACKEWIESIVKNSVAIPKIQSSNDQNIQINIVGEIIKEPPLKVDTSIIPFLSNERRRRSRIPPFDEMPF